MQPQNQTDHIAILALMMTGVLIRRLDEVGYLDDTTARNLHKLVAAVRTHAKSSGITDLNILFDNIDRTLGERSKGASAP